MFIHKKRGALTLEYMNQAEMQKSLFLLYDGYHKGMIRGAVEGAI